jgi:phenylacetate-CoA ligase
VQDGQFNYIVRAYRRASIPPVDGRSGPADHAAVTLPEPVLGLSEVEIPDLASRYFEPALELMERSELERLQEERLLEIVPYAYERSGLMRTAWEAAGVHPRDIRTIDDFCTKAPFIDKDDMREYRVSHSDPFGGMLCTPPDQLWVLGSTSGTTGIPTPLPQQHHNAMTIGLARDFWEIGARPGDMVANLMFTFRSAHGIERFERLPLSPIFINQGTDDLPAFFEACRRFNPVAVYTMNNVFVSAMAAYAEATGEDPKEVLASCKGVTFGGEPMSVRTESLLEEWGVRCHEMTTLGDVCGAVACQESAGFHAWEDLAFVEHLELDGPNPVRDGGRGELVVTSLADHTGPVVRYRTGDIVELTRERCRCGRTHARFSVLGRKEDELVLDGRSFLPRDLWPAIEAVPQTRSGIFQLIRPQRECTELRLRVGFSGDEADAGLMADLVASVYEHLGIEPVIELVPDAVLLRLGPPHKIPRVSAT